MGGTSLGAVCICALLQSRSHSVNLHPASSNVKDRSAMCVRHVWLCSLLFLLSGDSVDSSGLADFSPSSTWNHIHLNARRANRPCVIRDISWSWPGCGPDGRFSSPNHCIAPQHQPPYLDCSHQITQNTSLHIVTDNTTRSI